MGILDKFKSQKEQEIQSTAAPKTPVAEPKAKADAKAPKAAKAPKKEAKAAALNAAHQGVILAPLVTEKSATLASSGQYVFKVAPGANRIQVRAAVRAIYGVEPASVNIQVVRGKKVRFGRRLGQRNNWKKAIVSLPKGKTIEVYEGV